ncbi:MAG: 50S ribosomal protein L9 [Immundisolibacteraceae bacterium]|nr:50S ribosomal protein L9 [Immundisolibacteraceae bacterium]
MEVILLERVRNLGDVGDKVPVKGGYGRNYLLPQGKAVFATKKSIAEFEARRAELEKVANEAKSEAETKAESFQDLVVKISCKAGDGGKLFGSVTVREIVAALAKVDLEVDKHDLVLPEGQIREVGEYVAEIHLHADVVSKITVEVVPE